MYLRLTLSSYFAISAALTSESGVAILEMHNVSIAYAHCYFDKLNKYSGFTSSNSQFVWSGGYGCDANVCNEDAFVAWAQGESDFSISHKYMISICDSMTAVQASVFAAQAYIETEFGQFTEACLVTIKPQPPNLKA